MSSIHGPTGDTENQLIVIVGINSRQGTSVGDAFIKLSNWRVRGLTRDPRCESSRKWQALGAEIVCVDDDYDNSVRSAFENATAIFAMTDYFTHLRDHSVHTLAEVTKMDVEEVAAHSETRQAKAILAAAAETEGLQRFVVSSLTQSNTYGKKGLFQIQSKHMMVKHLCQNYEELHKKTSLIKPAFFMEDYKKLLQKKEDGTFVFGTTIKGDIRLPWVRVNPDIGKLTQMLISIPPCQNLAAISEWLSGHEICDLFTKISNLPCEYKQYSVAELTYMIGHRGEFMADMLGHAEEQKYYDERQLLPPATVACRYHSLITMVKFEDYLREDLPGMLEEALGPVKGTPIRVFSGGRGWGPEEARATSEAVAAQGFKNPRVRTSNSHDRNRFVGNH